MVPRIVERYTVPGRPEPAGSKRAFRVSGGRKFVVVDANRNLRSWQTLVATIVSRSRAGRPILSGPIRLALVFRMPRPKSHYGTGRNRNALRPGAPAFCATKPDLSKLVRAVEDALTGIVYADDSQVVELRAVKRYGDAGEMPRMEILVGVFDGDREAGA